MYKNKKILIIGGVAGGATAAARLRRIDEKSEIILFEKGEYVSFANCGLPYYIGGVIENRESLFVQTEKGIEDRYNIDVRPLNEVLKINREEKEVIVKDLEKDKEYTESYDQLILSPGASPLVPPISGVDRCDNLFTLRNIKDTDQIKEFLEKNKPQKVVVIGGGFVGIEMAENLTSPLAPLLDEERGIREVTLIEMTDQVLDPLDYEMASMVHNHLKEKGINLIFKNGVKEFKDGGKKIILEDGEEIESDLNILSVGITPNSELAKDAGLDLNDRGYVKVDDFLQTSDPNIYAIGDVIEVKDFVTGKPISIPLAWPANRQGRIVADNLYREKSSYRRPAEEAGTKYNGTMGTAIVKVFDLTVATTGLNEKQLEKANLEYEVVHIHPNSHAGYYPGASPISLKLLFNKKSGKIYGAQTVGQDGIDKRIDVIATAIKAGLTADDLADLELAYSPQYSSAKDPVNMAGYVASNIMNDDVQIMQWNEVDDFVKQGGVLIDLREPEELVMGEINGSMNIPLPHLRSRLKEIPKEKEIVFYCAIGLRGYLGARILELNGYYKVKNLDGGYKTYESVYSSEKENSFDKVKDTVILEDTGISKKITKSISMKNIKETSVIDCSGLQCPGPLKKLFEEIQKLKDGDILKIISTDIGFKSDVNAWCDKTNNTLLSVEDSEGETIAFIQKGRTTPVEKPEKIAAMNEDRVTLIAFSGDLDKALATFIIATGAVSFGKKVSVFFTFWGLNILRKNQKVKVDKTTMEKAFGTMMPRGTEDLSLSRMNMMGMGTGMMKSIMKEKNVESLESLMGNAVKSGVKLIACSMSMDIMGIKKEELIDGIKIGGVGTYLGDAQDSAVTLFI